MLYLTAAVVVVGAVGLLNLILSLGIIKRLRDQAQVDSAGTGLLAAGNTVSDFVARAVDGRPVSRGSLEIGAVVGFFSPTCQPCKEILPAFADYAATAPGGRAQVFAVVVGEAAQASDLISRLGPVATVLLARPGEPIVTSFAASGFPALYLMGEAGLVAASGHSMEVLPELAML